MLTLDQFRATKQVLNPDAQELLEHYLDLTGGDEGLAAVYREEEVGYPGVKNVYKYQWVYNLESGSKSTVLVVEDNRGFVWYWGHPDDSVETTLEKAEEQLFEHFVC